MKTQAHIDLEYKLNREAEMSQEVLDAFRADMERDPLYAFSWSANAFAAAARISIAREFLARLSNAPMSAGDLGEWRAELQTRVMRAARYPSSSTSAASNLAEQHKAQAEAELLEFLLRLE